MRHPSLAILDKTCAVMGIVNVTPDSFFDGGRFGSNQDAIDFGARLLEEGADILDIGGESTRPGAKQVSADEECDRIVPVISTLAREKKAIISVDTSKAVVAAAALDAGAAWINDISAGRFDGGMASLVAERQCPVVLMHSRGTPQTMQQNPSYVDTVSEVCSELSASTEVFLAAGVDKENIILDPGIGFAKRLKDNLVLLRNLGRIVALGYPVLVGTSRKSFIGTLTGKKAADRLAGSIASTIMASLHGARIVRVHDVASTVDALAVAAALRA